VGKIAIDRAALTGDQVQELDRWEQFFHGPIWRDIVTRFNPEIEGLQNSYHNVVGEQMLGRTQGALSVYYRILVHLPDLIHTEFLVKTGQIGADEGHSEDDPVSPEDWRR
jgi:hypothetical protein|tara:strand:+ start:1290 stop:1619 length:330 start_codon:yes stop_codon:yes gene_type:complete